MFRLVIVLSMPLLFASEALSLGMERIGNESFSEINYTAWPNVMPVINSTHRVYHTWVNGNEHFYFQGDTDALNTALKNFAAIRAEQLTVVIRPGPGEVSSFDEAQEFSFDWKLHLLGGVASHMSTLDLAKNVWDPSPYLYIYTGGTIELEKIEIPSGVTLLEIDDLRVRYVKSLASNDKTVRGWTCGRIARLAPYNADSMRRVAVMLEDQHDWVKLNAAGALAQFAVSSAGVIEKLEAVTTDDDSLRGRIDKTIASLRVKTPNDNARQEHQDSLASIHAFVAKHRRQR